MQVHVHVQVQVRMQMQMQGRMQSRHLVRLGLLANRVEPRGAHVVLRDRARDLHEGAALGAARARGAHGG